MFWKSALVLSLLANAALAYLLATRPRELSRTLPAPAPPAAAVQSARLDWSAVEAPDYEKYVRNLRAIGCPEETIYDIVVADVSTMFAMRARTAAPAASWRYWDPRDGVPTAEEIRNQRLRRELEREKQALILRILGPGAQRYATKYDLWGGDGEADRKLAFLDGEKRARLEDLQAKFHQLEQDATEWDANGAVTDAAQARIVALEKQARAEIAALLTPAELLDYDLRASPTAERLRRELNGFHPTEQEFRQLYAQRQAHEEQLAATADVRDPRMVAERERGAQEIERQLHSSLGETRYREYLRSTDLDYQNALHVTNYLGLPEQAASGIYDLKLRNDAEANQALADAALSGPQRQAIFDRLRADAESRLQALLGRDGFATYRQSNRWWLRDN